MSVRASVVRQGRPAGKPEAERALAAAGFRLTGRPGCRYADLSATGRAGHVEATVRLSPDGGIEWATVRAHLPPGIRAADVAAAVRMLARLAAGPGRQG